ncbi:MAG: FkbH like protein [Bryobacterales bacterium]|nr:FkbH like protein [Bryobacterales bacterium]
MPPPSRESDPTSARVRSLPSTSEQKEVPVVAVSATFTAEALEPALAFWLNELKLDYQIQFAPYNQVFQQLFDPAGLLAHNRNGLNVVLVRFEDWARFRDTVSVAELEADVRNFESALRSAAASSGSPWLVCLCPASPDFLGATGHADFVKRSEEFLRTAWHDLSTVRLLAAPDLNRLYPVRDYYDPHADKLGHVPYTPEFFTALGTMIARTLHPLRVSRSKVIALDCDDTLWQGVCGEDGPHGVHLDEGTRALQEFMLAQREAGMLLCLCSKNNAEDVYETFRAHPEMPLSLDDFSAVRLNWEPKSQNLRALARELNLGLESFVLVDNSAAECAEVQASCPEVVTLPLPATTGEFGAFLKHVWVFDHWSTTQEDRERSAMYAQQADRASLERQSANLEEFLSSLKLHVRMAPMQVDQLPRVAQLSQRTNQMNFTTIRRTENEIQNLLRSGGFECLTVDVSDRFGRYGLTGVIIFHAADKALSVDTFLLSCRVLGRGVEHRMLARLGEIALERGLGETEVPFMATPRNRPAELLLTGLHPQAAQATPTGSHFHFSAEYLADLRYTARKEPASAADEGRVTKTVLPSPKPVDYGCIARDLREPAQILEAVRAAASSTSRVASSDGPRTELEKQLVHMWEHLLGVPSVGIHDNFFDLGGHSLLAVQLLSLVRQAFDVDLSLKVVYSGDFTVAELAKAVEVREIEDAGADHYAAVLAEIENLSDEEVRALLAQEQNGATGGKL